MINKELIIEFLKNSKDPYIISHGADEDYLGFGMLYYSLAYSLKAKKILVLGSGGGFVPSMFKMAQRDIGFGDTILVDGNVGNYGRPIWLENNSFFKKEFPEIKTIIKLTTDAYMDFERRGEKFDIIHIDADHSYEGVLEDFENYKNIINYPGIITIHDTSGYLPCSRIVNYLKENNYNIINFGEYYEGLAIVKFDTKINNNYLYTRFNEDSFKSQYSQDKVLLELIGNKQNGFFVELGALDGVDISNSYFFEKELRWNGVCIEAVPDIADRLKQNRKCHTFNALVSDVENVEKDLILIGAVSGVLDENSGYWINQNLKNPVIQMKTRTLENILNEVNAPEDIDFLSLDVEGHEYTILKSFPFDKYKVNIFCIEDNSPIDGTDMMDKIDILLKNNNYEKIDLPLFMENKPCDVFYKLKINS